MFGRRRIGALVVVLAACGDAGGEGTETATDTGDGSSGTLEPTGGEVDILEQLGAIDGLDVDEWPSEIDGYRYFVLGFEQPADHDDPDGPTFVQRMTLLHRDAAAPLVMVTGGYFIYPDSPALSEPAQLLAGNQLAVAHRFFPPSRADAADWSHLTIEQSAADHHRIAEAFNSLYGGPWVATGASKSGMASTYFRRFYPDDVDATIAYVAPQSYGDADPRYLEFVATRGDAACRDALLKLQREVLIRRGAMVARMQAEAEVEGYTYTILNEEQALESAALELLFTYWQYEDATLCPEIPAVDAADDDAVWEFFNYVVAPKFWSDDWYLGYEPYFFQAATQLGYPAYDEGNVEDLLMYPGLDVAATYVLPERGPVALDAGAMPGIADWLATEGERVMFVYGENDPYTAAAFDPAGNPGVLRFDVPGGNHGAQIQQLPAADREAALAALEAWTGVTPTIPAAAPLPARLRLRGHAW